MPNLSLTSLQRHLLQFVQADFPLVPRPYRQLAEQAGATEGQVIEALAELSRLGLIRELAPVFATARLGYSSTLAALAVPEAEVERVAAVINAYPEVTHNYLRDHRYNLWFTVTAPSQPRLAEVLKEIETRSGAVPAIMPTRRQFKIRVVFDFSAEEAR